MIKASAQTRSTMIKARICVASHKRREEGGGRREPIAAQGQAQCSATLAPAQPGATQRRERREEGGGRTEEGGADTLWR